MGIIESPDPAHVIMVFTTVTQVDDDGTMIPTQRDIFPASIESAKEFLKGLTEAASDIKIVQDVPKGAGNGR